MLKSQDQLPDPRIQHATHSNNWDQFKIVLDGVSREVQGGLLWELLYADVLVLMAESEPELKEKLLRWRSRMEAKGLKVNFEKTEVMNRGEGLSTIQEFGYHLCGVCARV